MATSDSYSEKVITLHNKMVDWVGEMIVYESDQWVRLLGMFRHNPLTTREEKSIKSIQDLFTILMDKEFIGYGSYEKFRNQIQGINSSVATRIKKYEEEIKDQMTLNKESKPMRDRQGSDKESKNDGRNHEVTENRGGRKRPRQESSDLSRRALTKAQKQKIHCKMVTKLSKELGRNMKNWEIFENNMKYLLNFGENELSEITNMFDACKKMAAKGDITIGEDYDKLIEVVEDVDKKLVKIIEEHLEEMGIEPSPERKRRRTRSSEDSL